MTVDCQWIEKNLEALFCDRLSEEETCVARAHVENCISCRREAQALNAIDPLIKSYFRSELEIARSPRVVHRARVFGVSGAAAVVAVGLLLLLIRTPQTSPIAPPVASLENTAPVASSPTPPPIKVDEAGDVLRAKPTREPNAAADRQPQATPPTQVVTSDAPDFHITDPAGYSHTLDDYRGHVVVIGVWKHGQTEPIANIERLYKAFAANPKFRFLGVSNERQAKPANTTFPVAYNQGSKLFGAQPGEFVLLDENGAVELRGSLVKDFESLRKALAK